MLAAGPITEREDVGLAFFDSRVSRFLIFDAGGSSRDLSPFITDVRGLPGDRSLNEVTALGDAGARFIPGIEDVAFLLSGIFDERAPGGPDAVLGPLRTHSSPVRFEYGPRGISAGSVRYSGSCWVASYRLRSRVGSRVEWASALQVDGAVSRGAFT